jgi:glycosyltransferase involved in cell wall biosynthesis
MFVGTVGPEIQQSIQEAGLNDYTEYKGFLPYHQVIEEIGNASYLLVCASEKRHVPGKLFEYLRSGKPILAFGDDNREVQNILVQTQAGAIFPLASSGREFFEHVNNFKTDMKIVRQFDRKEIAGKLAQILQAAISEK